jgi:glucose/arabinose dehydrogenase
VLAPEYGGNGKTIDRCAGKDQPIMWFPGHWAPNDLLFYTGNQFPARYKNGAFVCFHGSWNRAPLKQGGYFVAFVPFGKDGKPSGKWEVFAEGFAGGPEIMSPNDAKARPMGLTQGADGSLYITDSVKGKIWRVMYGKNKAGKV